MGEAGKAFFDYLSSDESPILKIAKMLGLLVTLLVIVFLLESAMGLITIGRLERKVNLLKELYALAESGLGSERQITVLFEDAVDDLAQYDPDLWLAVSEIVPQVGQVDLVEVLVAASSWFFVAYQMLQPGADGTRSGLNDPSVVLAISLGLAVGVIASVFVESPSPIVSAVVVFVIGLSPLILLSIWSNKRNSGSQTETENPETSGDSLS